jgi:hypothetical protein
MVGNRQLKGTATFRTKEITIGLEVLALSGSIYNFDGVAGFVAFVLSVRLVSFPRDGRNTDSC